MKLQKFHFLFIFVQLFLIAFSLKDKEIEVYNEICYLSCPVNYTRIDACVCQTGDELFDCNVYGNPIYAPIECEKGSFNEENRTCVIHFAMDNRIPVQCNSATENYCKTKVVKTDLSLDLVGCLDNEEFWSGLCYPKCPKDFVRTTHCSCFNGHYIDNCALYGPVSSFNSPEFLDKCKEAIIIKKAEEKVSKLKSLLKEIRDAIDHLF